MTRSSVYAREFEAVVVIDMVTPRALEPTGREMAADATYLP